MRSQIAHVIGLGFLLACIALGILFGADIARYRHMQNALADLEACGSHSECVKAMEIVQLVAGKGRR